MAMNNKGQVFLVGLMLGILAFFAAMTFIDPMADVITEQRNATHLDCGNSSISDGQKGTCLVLDATLPIFIGVVIGLAGALITARFV